MRKNTRKTNKGAMHIMADGPKAYVFVCKTDIDTTAKIIEDFFTLRFADCYLHENEENQLKYFFSGGLMVGKPYGITVELYGTDYQTKDYQTIIYVEVALKGEVPKFLLFSLSNQIMNKYIKYSNGERVVGKLKKYLSKLYTVTYIK